MKGDSRRDPLGACASGVLEHIEEDNFENNSNIHAPNIAAPIFLQSEAPWITAKKNVLVTKFGALAHPSTLGTDEGGGSRQQKGINTRSSRIRWK